jgi:OOP family OmpA-OmpF porin
VPAGRRRRPRSAPVPGRLRDKSTLDAAAIKTLTAAIKVLQDNPDVDLVVEGHTGSIGTQTDNQALSERRAKSVYDYLVKHGVAANRLSMESFGEDKPAHDNSKEETRRLNRRVVLRVK